MWQSKNLVIQGEVSQQSITGGSPGGEELEDWGMMGTVGWFLVEGFWQAQGEAFWGISISS